MYTYIPDTYNYNNIDIKFENMDSFIRYQEKYKTKFEEYLYKLINFNELDSFIKNQDVNIPRVLDDTYNFYHNNSGLKSSYIFMRNNIHLERLSEEDLKILINNDKIDDEYFSRTFIDVLHEEGDGCFFGTPIDRNLVPSDSIVLEFAYNINKCDDLEQLSKIEEIIDYSFDFLKTEFASKSNIKVSFIVYDAIRDIFDISKEKSFL